jgi:Flp pilus assembly pilin Flp
MRNDQRGAAAVEFAIILPLLVVFVFGIIEFGLVLYDKAVVTNASREAARAGILYHEPRITEDEMRTVALNYCSGLLVTFGSISNCALDLVPPNDICDGHGDLLTVQVTYQYDFLLIPDFMAAWFGGNIPDPIDVSTLTRMRCE